MNQCNKEIKSVGIVHFWDLPNTLHVILDPKFKSKLMEEFLKRVRTKYNAHKITGIKRITIFTYINKKNPKIRIDFLLKIVNVINNKKFNLDNIEKHIKWVGHFGSQGIINPKLPFNFSSREGVRFLAAICNDGWISDGAYYSNSEKELRDSVKKDVLFVFGGNKDTIKEWVKEKDQYLAFPLVIRDVLLLVTEFKGVKSENNPPIPPFILEDEELILGWVEQTIADEEHVKYYPKKYRREITWRRSFSKGLNVYRLNGGERKMLEKIGIEYDLKDMGDYKTKNGLVKVKLQMRIARRKNLLKLRKLITIPHKRKDRLFTKMMSGFVRYKEPLRIKNKIIKTCKKRGFITSSMLKKEMNYKEVNTAIKWIKEYSKQGLLKLVKESSYGGAVGKIPASYTLSEPKRF